MKPYSNEDVLKYHPQHYIIFPEEMEIEETVFYSKEIHIPRLMNMLEKKWPNGKLGCPAAPNFNSEQSSFVMWKGPTLLENNPCYVCIIFIGLDYDSMHTCPCFHCNSCEEAAKRSWLKLEEEGMI